MVRVLYLFDGQCSLINQLTNRKLQGFLKSTLHRVTLPPVQDNIQINGKLMTKSRYSIPYFVSADEKSVIECLSVCTDEEHPIKYEPVVQEDYRRMRARGQYVETAGTSVPVS